MKNESHPPNAHQSHFFIRKVHHLQGLTYDMLMYAYVYMYVCVCVCVCVYI